MAPARVMAGATRSALPGGRWHFQHGPIDLVIAADGVADAVAAAHEAAWARFAGVLDGLVAELPLLRRPVGAETPLPQGVVARRMALACRPFLPRFITPMAAVAGAVAEQIIAAYQRPGIARAAVNNGGDIALHLTAGQHYRIGLYADLARFDDAALVGAGSGALALDGRITVPADAGVRGVATSGWRGRSHSLGIADSVTVLAATAAQADAAATLVANAVDVDDARIERRPACELRDDSDLGARLVTVGVPPLSAAQCQAALAAGASQAREFIGRGLIVAAALVCQGQRLQVGAPAGSALDLARSLLPET